jgi:hypothetical protein
VPVAFLLLVDVFGDSQNSIIRSLQCRTIGVILRSHGEDLIK